MARTRTSSLIRSGPRMNWVSSCGWKISIGVLGAVGIVSAARYRKYLDFSVSYRDAASASVWVAPGLQNLGNNCFLNVVLQALSSCSSFREYLWEMMEGYGSYSVEEVDNKRSDENLPLFSSLASLVEELCTLRHQRTVLSPRRLMSAMDYYIPNFNLSRQQDAEEAFSHLLSSLREEISEHCVPTTSSLADLPALPNVRILTLKTNEEENDWQKWRRSFLKPFDGILGSFLVCQSCSFQISLDFQLFHSLHLSPPVSNDGTIMTGCTLEDCLKRYFVAEHIENYRCSNCWHTAAIEYVSIFKDETDIDKLRSCNRSESCECKKLSSLEAFPWSNRFSHTLKQLSIAYSPKILCIHFQRASYNLLGQSMKLRGHVSFPSILDLSSFVNTEVGIKPTEANSPFMPLNIINHRATIFPRFMPEERERSTAVEVEYGPRSGASRSFRLVSVVEHFGSSGGGHYTVYKKVRGKMGDDGDHVAVIESGVEQWFSISDSQVVSVLEREVLDANASMLFYEKLGSD